METINSVQLSPEVIQQVQDAFYMKLGYENLIATMDKNAVPTDLMLKYGKACGELSDIGEKIISETWGDNSNGQIAKSWNCDFGTGVFTIERA